MSFKLTKYWHDISKSVTHPVDGFFETVTSATVHLHKSKAVVIPRVDNRWQQALRHTIRRSSLEYKITQTKHLTICRSAYRQ